MTFCPTTITALRLELKRINPYYTQTIVNEILEKWVNHKQDKYFQNRKKIRVLQAILFKEKENIKKIWQEY